MHPSPYCIVLLHPSTLYNCCTFCGVECIEGYMTPLLHPFSRLQCSTVYLFDLMELFSGWCSVFDRLLILHPFSAASASSNRLRAAAFQGLTVRWGAETKSRRDSSWYPAWVGLFQTQEWDPSWYLGNLGSYIPNTLSPSISKANAFRHFLPTSKL